MPARTLACVGLLAMTAARFTPVWAQRTGDQARLIFTVSAGAVGGKDLWFVPQQAVQFPGVIGADTLALGRDIRPTLVIAFGSTYYPGDHFGFGAEGLLIGLGYEDSCRQVFSTGSPSVAEACQSLQGATKSATAVILSGGVVYRMNSRKLISPYFRANAGFVFSNQSSLRTIGRYSGTGGERLDLIIYSDDHDSRVDPGFALGAGFTAALSPGYQLRWEIRDNITGVQKISGPSPRTGDVIDPITPHELEFKHLISITIGLDIVLERRRGRRY
ncbi:MAG TPA: hypothetical protein VGN76_15715 [Gemmatimonadales bacterium]|nr:hypothetical protein [Gemmatimonadales bacterium]